VFGRLGWFSLLCSQALGFLVCGLLLLWSSETGFWVSDDLLADVFRGQSPRYGFYGCLNTLDGVSDGFLLRRLRVAACVMGLFRRSSETGFGVSDDLFAGVFRGQSPRYGRFQTTFGIGADSW
jgi:amiloride-sensitive sodium channel subunit gamma (epithelial Na(+)channel subunit gamma)